MIKKILTIAGSDCSGGAGIEADIKTITAHKLYAMSAITALTAQNTTGVYGIMETTPTFLANQLDCIFTDIRPDAIKIGMVSNAALINVIAHKLTEYNGKNIVIDPVMISTSGSPLLWGEALHTLKEKLLPLGTLLTPNIPEAEVLCGFSIKNEAHMQKAAKCISERFYSAVLVKGGHLFHDATDWLYADHAWYQYPCERIDNPNTHGTGCTLSSAIACNLADGKNLDESVKKAKEYLTGALRAGLNLGKGIGPLAHTYKL
ncbi:MAG: bifunctional hydroxymethylpyrimidine kinase/phosphomethylpyrimidine kinase [Anaerovorax sp.]